MFAWSIVPRQFYEFFRLFGWKVGNNDAVYTGLNRVSDKFLFPVFEYRVVVRHEDQWYCRMLSYLLNDEEHFCKRSPRLKSPSCGFLYGWTICERVGERHPEFDNIGAASFQKQGVFQSRLRGGVAGHNIRDESFFPVCPESFEQSGYLSFLHVIYAQRLIPFMFATCCTSLSPRPDRLTIIIPSRGISGARLITSARA